MTVLASLSMKRDKTIILKEIFFCELLSGISVALRAEEINQF